ncbi:YraN family protein [Gordonia sp. (in: high G+C Gram-positive bacteria)]|uniref:YraN family protein n=1 Tax=Gordonia sp. (in: high G+C Gram-positive bacteria) TaxID=84139 RepID=UPI00168DC4C9|nr:YraN family protein [Gordonia sp. (in: high G+C Gram-positive bacteria)]NLG45627.1 YraN family protein [Gordonia sp. (in: high G+C Gram-positive bacteria)]
MGEQRARAGTDRRRLIGQIGEDIAAEYVATLGWQILARNWRTRNGELDLIAADGDTLVVVEVKTRASRTYTDPLGAVTPQKLRRMRLLARQWLAQQERFWETVRFDVVSVQLDVADPEDLARATWWHHVGVEE